MVILVPQRNRDAAHWIEAGLELLRREGQTALTIERMCTRLRCTKGSFYHHFANVDAFHQSLLRQWEQRNTHVLIDASAGPADTAAERATTLAQHARRLDARLELAIRAWALHSPIARARVANVDRQRLKHLEDLWRDRAAKVEPAHLAALDYCSFLGALQLFGATESPLAVETERLLDAALTRIAKKGMK